MSSQDTMNYAEQEQQSAKTLEDQIRSHEMSIEALQRDIDSKRQIIEGLRQKEQQHLKDADKLRAQASQEQQQEEQERLRQQQEDERDSLAKKAAKEYVVRSLF